MEVVEGKGEGGSLLPGDQKSWFSPIGRAGLGSRVTAKCRASSRRGRGRGPECQSLSAVCWTAGPLSWGPGRLVQQSPSSVSLLADCHCGRGGPGGRSGGREGWRGFCPVGAVILSNKKPCLVFWVVHGWRLVGNNGLNIWLNFM